MGTTISYAWTRLARWGTHTWLAVESESIDGQLSSSQPESHPELGAFEPLKDEGVG